MNDTSNKKQRLILHSNELDVKRNTDENTQVVAYIKETYRETICIAADEQYEINSAYVFNEQKAING